MYWLVKLRTNNNVQLDAVVEFEGDKEALLGHSHIVGVVEEFKGSVDKNQIKEQGYFVVDTKKADVADEKVEVKKTK